MTSLTPDETILGILAAYAQHGYQILETFNDPQKLGRVWHLSTSQLYAVLKRLEREGWIAGRQIESENAPPRTQYAITSEGRNILEAWLNDGAPSPSIRHVRVEFLSRLYVAQLLGHSVESIITRQRLICQNERTRLLANAESGFGLLASDLVIAQLDAVLEWLERCVLVFDSHPSEKSS